MRKTLKRILVLMLAVTTLASLMLPAALAASANAVKFGKTTLTTYVGLKTELEVLDAFNDAMAPGNYNWTTSDKKIVTVSAKGVITAQKAGKAKITATSKKNKKEKATVTVTVKKNKVDNINPKPTASAVTYKSGAISLKSVEITSPSSVAVEYYMAVNYPSSWKVTKVTEVSDAINLFNPGTGAFEKTIVGDDYQLKSKKISGFKSKKGKFVQVIKVTYSGSRVKCANIRLRDYKIDNSRNVSAHIKYTR